MDKAEALQKIVDETNRIGKYRAELIGKLNERLLIFGKKNHKVKWSVFYDFWGEYNLNYHGSDRVNTVFTHKDFNEICIFIHV